MGATGPGDGNCDDDGDDDDVVWLGTTGPGGRDCDDDGDKQPLNKRWWRFRDGNHGEIYARGLQVEETSYIRRPSLEKNVFLWTLFGGPQKRDIFLRMISLMIQQS